MMRRLLFIPILLVLAGQVFGATFHVWKNADRNASQTDCGGTVCYSTSGFNDASATGANDLNTVKAVADDAGGNVVIISGGTSGVTYTGAEIRTASPYNLPVNNNSMTWRTVEATDDGYAEHNGTVTIDGSSCLADVFILQDASQTIKGFRFINTSAVAAIRIDCSGELVLLSTIDSCVFEDNSDDSNGGALYTNVTGGTLDVTISNSTFNRNQTTTDDIGGAVYIGGARNVIVSSCAFTGNNADDDAGNAGGGGLDVRSSTSLVLTDSTFTNNTAAVYGGGASIMSVGTVSISGCTFSGNETNPNDVADVGHGGGLYIEDYVNNSTGMTVTMTDCLFDGNKNLNDTTEWTTGGDGSQFKVKGYDSDDLVAATVTDTIFQNGVGNLGAFHNGRYSHPVLVERCKFLNNTAWHQGGALLRGGAEGDPGGILNEGETTTIKNSLFAGNRAGYDYDGNVTSDVSYGGAIHVYDFPKAIIQNCTFYDNHAAGVTTVAGDAIYVMHDTAAASDPNNTRSIVENCIFSGTGTNKEIDQEDVGDSFIRFNYNAYLEGESDASATSTQVGNIMADPLLNTDYTLQASSPCINAGTTAGTVGLYGIQLNSDGETVPIGRRALLDIGAYPFDHITGIPRIVSGNILSGRLE